MIPSDSPTSFERLQFPIFLVFAMTIDKSQGQIMTILFGKSVLSSRSKLYVACSRIGKLSNLFVYTPKGLTKNIVNIPVIK